MDAYRIRREIHLPAHFLDEHDTVGDGGHGTGGRGFSEDIRLVKDSMATSSSGKVTSY